MYDRFRNMKYPIYFFALKRKDRLHLGYARSTQLKPIERDRERERIRSQQKAEICFLSLKFSNRNPGQTNENMKIHQHLLQEISLFHF